MTSIAEKTREFHVYTVLLDSPEFDSLTRTKIQPSSPTASPLVTQFDVAAILYSSGTIGKVKGVMQWYVILFIVVIQPRWYLQYFLSQLDQPRFQTALVSLV